MAYRYYDFKNKKQTKSESVMIHNHVRLIHKLINFNIFLFLFLFLIGYIDKA